MKKSLLFLAAAAFAFTSCDKIAEIENFGVGHTFDQEFVLDVKDSDPTTFQDDFVVDVTSDKDFADNLSKISGYTVNKVSYRISDFTGNSGTTATGSIQFFNETSPLGSVIDMGLISFEAMLNSGNSVEIPVSDDLKTILQDQLLNNHTLRIVLDGEVSDKPMTATTVLELEIEALVKVN